LIASFIIQVQIKRVERKEKLQLQLICDSGGNVLEGN